MAFLSEAEVESALLDQLAALGYQITHYRLTRKGRRRLLRQAEE